MHISDKRLFSRIYKELSKFNIKETHKPIQNSMNYLNTQFTKEDTHIVNKYMERCSTSSVIGKVEVKTTKNTIV